MLPCTMIMRSPTVAGYAALGFNLIARDPNSEVNDDEFSELRFIAPGLNLAVDVPLTEWLYARTGLRYLYAFTSQSDVRRDRSGEA